MQKTDQKSKSHSFEQMHKSSYSHGLEKIYSLETVDLSTVKVIKSVPSKEASPERPEIKMLLFPEAQLSFSFGYAFSQSMDPFVLREPVQMLELSKKIEDHLISKSRSLIGDLLQKPSAVAEWTKGLGQGHLDEIETKLQKYIEGTSIHFTKSIDFLSWLKTLILGVTFKKAAALFESYNLPTIVSLSMAEKWELHHLSDEKRQAWIGESIQEFRSESKAKCVKDDFQRIIQVFIKPWVEGRFGLVTHDELLEKLFHVSYSKSTAEQALQWFSTIYFDEEFPLQANFFPLHKGLYALDVHAASAYKSIVDVALSYFYNPKVHYPLSTLVLWIARETAKRWLPFSLLRIEKVLRLCPNFRIRKATTGELTVKLNPFGAASQLQ